MRAFVSPAAAAPTREDDRSRPAMSVAPAFHWLLTNSITLERCDEE